MGLVAPGGPLHRPPQPHPPQAPGTATPQRPTAPESQSSPGEHLARPRNRGTDTGPPHEDCRPLPTPPDGTPRQPPPPPRHRTTGSLVLRLDDLHPLPRQRHGTPGRGSHTGSSSASGRHRPGRPAAPRHHPARHPPPAPPRRQRPPHPRRRVHPTSPASSKAYAATWTPAGTHARTRTRGTTSSPRCTHSHRARSTPTAPAEPCGSTSSPATPTSTKTASDHHPHAHRPPSPRHREDGHHTPPA
ncbi:hypothetical protein EES40_19220 [Streptomyces sp. ADI93-02]|nr:hypothetical protein EES40_19220 [Streptomyces sp. ADI93-02]